MSTMASRISRSTPGTAEGGLPMGIMWEAETRGAMVLSDESPIGDDRFAVGRLATEPISGQKGSRPAAMNASNGYDVAVPGSTEIDSSANQMLYMLYAPRRTRQGRIRCSSDTVSVERDAQHRIRCSK
jgi:hypothetical protein